MNICLQICCDACGTCGSVSRRLALCCVLFVYSYMLLLLLLLSAAATTAAASTTATGTAPALFHTYSLRTATDTSACHVLLLLVLCALLRCTVPQEQQRTGPHDR
jgi:hypothetical protein